MPTITQANFNGTLDTALQSAGYPITFTKHAGTGNFVLDGAGGIYRKDGSDYIQYRVVEDPGSADGVLEFTFKKHTAVGEYFGMTVRGVASTDSGYHVQYQQSVSRWRIFNAPTYAIITSSEPVTLLDDTSYTMRVEITGTLIKLFQDGVQIAMINDSTHTLPGELQIILPTAEATSTTGIHITSFEWVPAVEDIITPVPVDSAHLDTPPQAWRRSGSTYIETNHLGNYIKLGFTGTALRALFDMSPLIDLGMTAGQYPWIEWSIDDGAVQTFQLASATTQLLLGSSLAGDAAVHRLWLGVMAMDPFVERWFAEAGQDGPPNVVRITGFEITNGETVAPAAETVTVMAYGDSTLEGFFAEEDAAGEALTQASKGPLMLLAQGLGYDISTLAFYGQSISSGSNSPGLFNTWHSYSDGHTMLSGGLFVRQPDEIWCNIGRNDKVNNGVTDEWFESAITGLVEDWRAAAPAAIIRLFVPFGGYLRQPLEDAVTALLVTDENVRFHDLGAAAESGMKGSAFLPTRYSWEGIHQNGLGSARFAIMMTKAITAGESAPAEPDPIRYQHGG